MTVHTVTVDRWLNEECLADPLDRLRRPPPAWSRRRWSVPLHRAGQPARGDAHAAGAGRARPCRDRRHATLTLRPGRGWRPHRAGQHVRVGLAIDGRIATRTYSISSATGAPRRLLHDHGQGAGPRVARARARRRGRHATSRSACPRATFVLPEPTPARDRCSSPAAAASRRSTSMLRTLAAAARCADVVHVHYATHAERRDLRRRAPRARGDASRLPADLVLTTAHDRAAVLARHGSTSSSPTGARARPGRAGRSACSTASTSFAAAPRGVARRALRRRARRRSRPTTRAAACGSRRARRDATPTASTPLLRVAEDGRRQRAARLPHGHLPHLRRDAGLRLRARPAHRRPHRPSPARASRSACAPRPATSSSTL